MICASIETQTRWTRSVLVVVIAMRGVTMPVVDVIHVIVVLHRLVTAIGSVGVLGVLVCLVLSARHNYEHMRMFV